MAITSDQLAAPSWNVFLSFYGKDTRGNFISHLYKALDQAGIKTFMDEPELRKGEEISGGLLSAIHGSKMSVVVLSQNYARSKWCLNELVEILGCKRINGQMVIPVFYYVDPSDVRNYKGSFGEALKNQMNLHSEDVVDKWKSAVSEIGKLKGYHLQKNQNENESDTIQEIVQKVAPQASTKVLHLEEHLFGIDHALEQIYQKLSMESNDVRAIGICGMGGIGKTTIAKAFYNKFSDKFDLSCFIDNVKQYSKIGNPLFPLLEQLLIDFLRWKDYKVPDVESGIRKLKEILFSRKALIVLDDLDQSSYSELLVRICKIFSAGSRIVVTTRDANLMNQLKVDIPEVDLFMVSKLGDTDSLELFSYHAFGKPVVPECFRELSLSFVTYSGGLPLALKVLGSSFRGRTQVSFWKAKLEKVRKIPENDIREILQLSYDELADDTEKAIFLDIAFFFVGKDKDEAVYVLNSCELFPDIGIPILVERCLLKIDQDNKFQMHNLIQDMGRELGRSTRLLLQGNAWKTLQTLEGACNIEILILDMTMSPDRNFDANIFKRMPKLKLLEIIDAHDIKGNFKNSFHELRCIHWCHCPWTRLPSNFRPEKLVSLDMPLSGFKTLWKSTKSLVNLKTINLSYSKNLRETPDFTDAIMVEKLLFRGCKKLLNVHPSIGQLTNLNHLDLEECEHLKELPKPIGQLGKLGFLNLHNWYSLKRLPEPLKQLTCLGCLNLNHCSNLEQLPEELGNMKGLKKLDASYTAIEKLPDSISYLKDLVELNLLYCEKLRKLPEQFGNIEGLRMFDASYTALEQLPDSFGCLINLVDLQLCSCKNLVSLSNGIWKLKFLQGLDLGNCSKLEQLPEQLGKMQSLERINASGTAIEELPDSIGLLSRLQELYLHSCKSLKYVPNSTRDLTLLGKELECLYLRCNIRLWLPTILSFSSLQTIHLIDDGKSLSSTKISSLHELSNLQYLLLENCTSLGSSLPELPLNLKSLSLFECATLEQLPDLSSLKRMNRLFIQRCNNLQSLPPLPPHLKMIEVYECTSLKDVQDLSMLKRLHYLCFFRCSNLKSVSLKQNSFQAGQFLFKATLPNREIAEWVSYKRRGCTISFDIPQNRGDNFLGVALWVVYKCKTTYSFPSIRAVITNLTVGVTKNHDIYVMKYVSGQVQSRIQCIRGDDFWAGGDRIEISYQKLLYRSNGDENVPCGGEINVEMCGVHLIKKRDEKLISCRSVGFDFRSPRDLDL